MSNSASEILSIYEGSNYIDYSDTFEKDSTDEKNAIKFIETYFYKFILRIQDNEVFSTRVAIYETIVYALSREESISKAIKILFENDKIFKIYGKELENILNSLKNNEEIRFDKQCNIDFLRNKIVIANSEKIGVNKIYILEEGHKEY